MFNYLNKRRLRSFCHLFLSECRLPKGILYGKLSSDIQCWPTVAATMLRRPEPPE